MPVIEYDPNLHPRDRLGRFRQVLGALQVGERLRLPGGIGVTRTRHGYALDGAKGRGGKRVRSLDLAARRALDASARSTAPGSVGGAKSYVSLDHAERAEGKQAARGTLATQADKLRQAGMAIQARNLERAMTPGLANPPAERPDLEARDRVVLERLRAAGPAGLSLPMGDAGSSRRLADAGLIEPFYEEAVKRYRVTAPRDVDAEVAAYAARGPWEAAHAEQFRKNLLDVRAEPGPSEAVRSAAAQDRERAARFAAHERAQAALPTRAEQEAYAERFRREGVDMPLPEGGGGFFGSSVGMGLHNESQGRALERMFAEREGRPSLGELQQLERERVADAERRLRGERPSDGTTPDEPEDLDALLDREARRGMENPPSARKFSEPVLAEMTRAQYKRAPSGLGGEPATRDAARPQALGYLIVREPAGYSGHSTFAPSRLGELAQEKKRHPTEAEVAKLGRQIDREIKALGPEPKEHLQRLYGRSSPGADRRRQKLRALTAEKDAIERHQKARKSGALAPVDFVRNPAGRKALKELAKALEARTKGMPDAPYYRDQLALAARMRSGDVSQADIAQHMSLSRLGGRDDDDAAVRNEAIRQALGMPSAREESERQEARTQKALKAKLDAIYAGKVKQDPGDPEVSWSVHGGGVGTQYGYDDDTEKSVRFTRSAFGYNEAADRIGADYHQQALIELDDGYIAQVTVKRAHHELENYAGEVAEDRDERRQQRRVMAEREAKAAEVVKGWGGTEPKARAKPAKPAPPKPAPAAAGPQPKHPGTFHQVKHGDRYYVFDNKGNLLPGSYGSVDEANTALTRAALAEGGLAGLGVGGRMEIRGRTVQRDEDAFRDVTGGGRIMLGRDVASAEAQLAKVAEMGERRARDQAEYEKRAGALRGLAGEKVRLFGRTGIMGRSGQVEVRDKPRPGTVFVAGSMAGGEITDVSKIDVKVGSRFVEVWPVDRRAAAPPKAGGRGEPAAAEPAPVKPFPTSYTRAQWAELTPEQRAEANRRMREDDLTASAAIRAVKKGGEGAAPKPAKPPKAAPAGKMGKAQAQVEQKKAALAAVDPSDKKERARVAAQLRAAQYRVRQLGG